jgi:MFS family permease
MLENTTGGYLNLLRNNKRVRQLWFAQIVSELGDWLNFVALIQIIKQFSGSAQASGLLIILQMMPLVIFSPFSGALADRFDRRKIMIVADLLRAGVVLGLLTIRRPDQLWLLYLLSAMQFSLTAFFEPARSALLPNLAKGEELIQANALTGVTWSIILALGGALGGIISDFFGNQIAFLVDSATFLLSAGILLRLNVETKHSSDNQEAKQVKDTSFLAVVPYLQAKPQVLAVMLIKSGICLTGGGVFLLSVVYGQQIFPIGKDGAISVGILYGVHGLGAVIGAALTGHLSKASTRNALNLTLIAFALRGIFFSFWAVSLNIWFAAASILSVAACGSFLWVISTTLLQKLTDDEIRGRLFALEHAFLTLSITLSIGAIGRALDVWKFSPAQTTFFTGLFAVVITALWGLIVFQWRKFDRLQQQN